MRHFFITILLAQMFGCDFNSSRNVYYEGYLRSLQLYKDGNFEDALINIDSILNHSRDYKILGDTEYLRGYICHLRDSTELAYFAFLNAKNHYNQINDGKGLSKCNNILGRIFYEYDSYIIARQYFDKAYFYSKKYDDDKLIANSLFGLGLVEKELGNLVRATEILEQVLDIEAKLKRLTYFIDVWLELGIVHHLAGSYRYALEKNWKAINTANGTDVEKITRARAYNNIGNIYLDKRNYKKAQQYLDSSLDLNVLKGSEVAVLYNNFGRLHHRQGNDFLAARFFKMSIDNNHHKTDMIEVAETKSNLEIMMENESLSKDSILLCYQGMLNVSVPDYIIRKRLEHHETKIWLETREDHKAISQLTGIGFFKSPWQLWSFISLTALCFIMAAFRLKARFAKPKSDSQEYYRQMRKELARHRKQTKIWMEQIKKDMN